MRQRITVSTVSTMSMPISVRRRCRRRKSTWKIRHKSRIRRTTITPPRTKRILRLTTPHPPSRPTRNPLLLLMLLPLQLNHTNQLPLLSFVHIPPPRFPQRSQNLNPPLRRLTLPIFRSLRSIRHILQRSHSMIHQIQTLRRLRMRWYLRQSPRKSHSTIEQKIREHTRRSPLAPQPLSTLRMEPTKRAGKLHRQLNAPFTRRIERSRSGRGARNR